MDYDASMDDLKSKIISLEVILNCATCGFINVIDAKLDITCS